MFSRSWEIQAYIVKLGKIEKHTPQRAYKIIYNEAFTSKWSLEKKWPNIQN